MQHHTYTTASCRCLVHTARLLALVVLASLPHFALAREKVTQQTMYMFGVALSFADSTAYISDVHPVEGVSIDSKTGFLKDQNLYSLQLGRHMSATHEKQNTITSVFYGKNRKKMENQCEALRRAYAYDKGTHLQVLDFRFEAEQWIEPTVVVKAEEKKALAPSKSKKQTKNQKKK